MAESTIGQHVRAAREALPLTRDQVAHAAGTSVSTVARLELNDHVPGVRTLAAIASVVGLDVGDLIGVAVAS